MKKIWIIAVYKNDSIDKINRLSFNYISAVENTKNAMPFIIPCNIKNIDYYIKHFDWFIFPWWDDIDPTLYWEENNWSKDYIKENDEFLLKFLDKIIKSDKQVLWICKWMQLINVYFWWKLVQHLENYEIHQQYNNQYCYVHRVKLEENRFLYNIFWDKIVSVNSIHHQAISKLWQWLLVSWISTWWDNVIEAIQHVNNKIYWIQWHPECIKEHQIIFNWFVSIN